MTVWDRPQLLAPPAGCTIRRLEVLANGTSLADTTVTPGMSVVVVVDVQGTQGRPGWVCARVRDTAVVAGATTWCPRVPADRGGDTLVIGTWIRLTAPRGRFALTVEVWDLAAQVLSALTVHSRVQARSAC